jgi:NAD(P)-dependent dehydrogenase (short-subunit alcohol dehydrogenase family)
MGLSGRRITLHPRLELVEYFRPCALELVKYSIRVNTVVLGYIDTGMIQAIPKSVKKRY